MTESKQLDKAKKAKKRKKKHRDLGVDEVAKKEAKKYKKKVAGVEQKDGFSKQGERERIKVADDFASTSGGEKQSLMTTGQVSKASQAMPIVSRLGLPTKVEPVSTPVIPPEKISSDELPPVEDIVAAAKDRIKHCGRHYAVNSKWKSPNPEIADNRTPDKAAIPDTQGLWKGTFFCLDVLYQAGFAVPTVLEELPEKEREEGKKPGQWYPNAVEVPKYTRGPTRHFHVVGVERISGIHRKQQRVRIAKILRKAQVGDLLVVLYLTEDGSEGGLLRLVMANDYQQRQTLEVCFASESIATVTTVGENDFIWDEALHLLRPARPRSKAVEPVLAAPTYFG